MTGPSFAIVVTAALLVTAAAMTMRLSRRIGVVLLALYAPQAACLAWISQTIDGAPWAATVRATMLAAIVAVLAHRATTYAWPRPPAARDRVLVPSVHIAQAWIVIELFVWPARVLAMPVSPSVDAWILMAPLAVSVLSLAWTHKPPRQTRIRVAVNALRHPLRVVHLSDLHVGPYVTDARLAWLADTVSAANPDLIAITGDFLTQRTQRDWSAVLRFAARLHAPHGVYACLGNHDVAVADALSATLRDNGVTVLRDRVAWLAIADGRPPIAVAGLDWHGGGGARPEYARAFAAAADAAGGDGPAVVLCHHPAAFAAAPPGFGGIMLAGHLHGGQVGVTWGARGVSILRLFGMYDQGLFTRGGAQLYSHRGTGVYGFPLRIGVPAEIAVLDLVPAERTSAIALQA